MSNLIAEEHTRYGVKCPKCGTILRVIKKYEAIAE